MQPVLIIILLSKSLKVYPKVLKVPIVGGVYLLPLECFHKAFQLALS